MADYDAELMLRTAQGDDDAFAELFERHYKRAVNIAYRSLGDADLAEDVAMDAFARVYQSRNSYKPYAQFTTFLYRVVVNLCLNAAKRRLMVAEETLADDGVAASDAADPAQRLQRSETARAVKTAVLALPANQRMALVLTRYDGMSYTSTAEAMGVSVGAVESLLHRAKASLRKALADLVE